MGQYLLKIAKPYSKLSKNILIDQTNVLKQVAENAYITIINKFSIEESSKNLFDT